MRIIAGEFKGRRLVTPDNNDIRPTSDKVREAVFSILMNDIYGAKCLDLFAGTGGVGLEALSRGASQCVFSDSSRDAVRIINENIKRCGAGERARIITGDYRKVLGSLREKFDLIFLDPPYRAGLTESCLGMVGSLDLLASAGIIVAEREAGVSLPDELCGFIKIKTRKYGKTGVDFFRRDGGTGTEARES